MQRNVRAIMPPMTKIHRVCRICGGKLAFVGICFRHASQLCEPEAVELVGFSQIFGSRAI